MKYLYFFLFIAISAYLTVQVESGKVSDIGKVMERLDDGPCIQVGVSVSWAILICTTTLYLKMEHPFVYQWPLYLNK